MRGLRDSLARSRTMATIQRLSARHTSPAPRHSDPPARPSASRAAPATGPMTLHGLSICGAVGVGASPSHAPPRTPTSGALRTLAAVTGCRRPPLQAVDPIAGTRCWRGTDLVLGAPGRLAFEHLDRRPDHRLLVAACPQSAVLPVGVVSRSTFSLRLSRAMEPPLRS